MKIKKKIKKILKPIEYDCHFKYKCPDPNCGYDYWISFKQANTKNYKIVCDCGLVFKPKRIKSIKPIYFETQKIVVLEKPKKEEPVVEEKTIEPEKQPEPIVKDIDKTILDKCVKILVGYGFTVSESQLLLTNSYRKCQESDCGKLIKYTLENMENHYGK